MELRDGLTNLQRVALDGEVAFTVYTATNDADIKYRIYYIFKEVERKYKPLLLEAFKRVVTFDESIIDRLYLESLTDKVPVWLWVEKAVSDLKDVANVNELVASRLSINKSLERKKIVESAFISFARKALPISPDASEELFNAILEDPELEFLHTSCFYLKNCCEEVRDTIAVQNNTPEALMECLFDFRDMLSLKVETEALELLDKKRAPRKRRKPRNEEILEGRIEIRANMTEAEIAELLNQRLSQLFGAPEPPKKKPTRHFQYVVNKVFTSSNISTSIKTCKTKKEAEEFIEKVKKEYPELKETCDFFISKEKIDGR